MKEIMGVMSCSRKNCENVMCSTYIEDIGYLCYQCQLEFRDYLESYNLNPNKEKEILKELNKFMESSKHHYTEQDEISVDEFFSKRTLH